VESQTSAAQRDQETRRSRSHRNRDSREPHRDSGGAQQEDVYDDQG